MDRQKVIERVDMAWNELVGSFADLSEAQMTEPRVQGEWSVRDVLAHVTTWEEEALKYLPLILHGGRAPRYSVLYGGIDAFNAQMTERKRGLALAEVLRQLNEVHRQLILYLRQVPEDQFVRETRFRRRLRLDTYSHYPIHAKTIEDWRKQRSNERNPNYRGLAPG